MVKLTIEQPTNDLPKEHYDCLGISVIAFCIEALLFLAIIIAVIRWIIKRYHKSEKYQLKKKAQNEGRVDFNDILQTAFSKKEVEELRRKLLAKCHPDRFIDQPLQAKKAEAFYKKVSKASTSFLELIELEKKINKEL